MTALERVIDLEAYVTWLATNSILKNADTVDELFLFEVRKDRSQPEPLRIMAWDYDEILQGRHTTKMFPDPLMFARRTTALDDLIKSDPKLYGRYRSTLRRLLTRDLTIERLVEELREVQALRDGLDDGLAPEVQDEKRRQRKATVDKFESDLRERHATLLERLESSS